MVKITMIMKIIVIKVGSSVLLTQRNKLDEFRIAHIADQILALKAKGVRVVLVISGAVACGASSVDLSSGDRELKQIAAGIGQAYLISMFQQIFSRKHLLIAQVLLTKDTLDSKDRKSQIAQLLHHYLQTGIIPVINENDVIDLNSFGGNDILSAQVSMLLNVDRLVILSTLEGSTYGVGGGTTKQEALSILQQKNIKANVLDGKTKNVLLENLV